MARIKKTSDYLKELQNKGYSRYSELFSLYDNWKKELDIEVLSNFLKIIWEEKDNIKPKYLGENTYNNFRGIAFEEFCFDILDKAIKESKAENAVELFWNEKRYRPRLCVNSLAIKLLWLILLITNEFKKKKGGKAHAN